MARIPLYAALLLSVALFGCGSPVSTEKNSTPGYDPANPSGGDPTDGLVNDNAGFFVKVTSDTAHTLITHRSAGDYYSSGTQPISNFATGCRILPSATIPTEKDILCIAEIEELDLYFSELKVQYHVPRTMCRYVRHEPYVFWENEPGTGPANVAWNVRTGGTFQNVTNSQEGKPIPCQYDYNPQNGPNCCTGTFQQTVGIQKSGSAGTVPSDFDYTVTTQSWGGNAASCLFGPAMQSQKPNAGGFPKPDIFYVENVGLNKTYTIEPAIGKNFFAVPVLNNFWAANFYNRSEHATGTQTVPPGYNAQRPIAMRLASTYTKYLPSDTYDFSCLDAAEEVKYRIRLMIREWNTNPIVETGSINAPDVNGADPNDSTGQLNDRYDWKDIQDPAIFPGSPSPYPGFDRL